VRIDPSATEALSQHLTRTGVVPGELVARFGQESFIPKYSGLNQSLLGLIVVIGPVDAVDKPYRCRWWPLSSVDDSWTGTLDNSSLLWTGSGHPQDSLRESVVIHRRGAVMHTLSSLSSQPGVRAPRTNVHRVIPRLWTGRVAQGHLAGHGRLQRP